LRFSSTQSIIIGSLKVIISIEPISNCKKELSYTKSYKMKSWNSIPLFYKQNQMEFWGLNSKRLRIDGGPLTPKNMKRVSIRIIMLIKKNIGRLRILKVNNIILLLYNHQNNWILILGAYIKKIPIHFFIICFLRTLIY
jgi:hypothetical protein